MYYYLYIEMVDKKGIKDIIEDLNLTYSEVRNTIDELMSENVVNIKVERM